MPRPQHRCRTAHRTRPRRGGTVPAIWLNRTYASHVLTIDLLRRNPAGEPVRIIATHALPDSPVLAVADVVEAEPPPEVVGEAYVTWALETCARHRIDVVIPRLHAAAVAGARDRFAAAGVGVVAPSPAAMLLLDDKAAAYAAAALDGLPVPPHRVVRGGAQLREAYDELARAFGRVCVKPVSGVGGDGFRELVDRGPLLQELLGPLQPVVDVRAAAAALDEAAGPVPPLLVLPFLPGPEVSVDCLADAEGTLLAAVPRTKHGYRRSLVDDPAAVAVARAIVVSRRLGFLSNTQVRYWRQPGIDVAPRPYLLETNARASGGIAQTALAGVNLPWAAVELALGRTPAPLLPRLGATFTTVPAVVAASVARASAAIREHGIGGEEVDHADVLVGDAEGPRPA